jgi:hypothetical protein
MTSIWHGHVAYVQTRNWIGQARLAGGDLDGAQAAFDTVHDSYGEDAGTGHAYALREMAGVLVARGDHRVAGQCSAVAAELARDGGDAAPEDQALLGLAVSREAQGRQDERVDTLQRAVAALSGGNTNLLQARVRRAGRRLHRPGRHGRARCAPGAGEPALGYGRPTRGRPVSRSSGS